MLLQNFPAHKVDEARHALEQAHKRMVRAATRAGQATPVAPTLAIVASRVRSLCRVCKLMVDEFPPDNHHCSDGKFQRWTAGEWTSIAVVDLELTAERPMLAGWEFLACVEPLEGGNLIRQVPGASIQEGELARWATGVIACDHCRAVRARKETFIVRADGTDPAVPAGTYKQVGRQCVAVFLGGQSPATIVAQVGWPAVVMGAAGEEEGWWGSRGAELFDRLRFLTLVAASIRLDGWVSRKRARETNDDYSTERHQRSTADHALYLITPPFSDPYGDWRREVARCAPTPEDVTRAADSLAWAQGLSVAPATDYERNLSLVARQAGLQRDHAGILASAVAAYSRKLGHEVEQRRQAEVRAELPSQHVGTVKERLDLELVVQRVTSIDTDYGALRIISMRDAANNLFVWKTGAINPTPGDPLKLRGTVKEHGEFRGEAQTVLTRCETFKEWPAKPVRRARARKVRALHEDCAAGSLDGLVPVPAESSVESCTPVGERVEDCHSCGAIHVDVDCYGEPLRA